MTTPPSRGCVVQAGLSLPGRVVLSTPASASRGDGLLTRLSRVAGRSGTISDTWLFGLFQQVMCFTLISCVIYTVV